MIAANNGKMPVKGSTANDVQLQTFISEKKVEFLVIKIEITPFFLGIEFLYNLNYILTPGKTNSFAAKLVKHYNFPHHNEVITICF